jgi:hypothetical protein
MSPLFSKRHRPAPASHRYDVPNDVRSRILYAIDQLSRDFYNAFDFGRMLQGVGDKLLVEYGFLRGSGFEAARVNDNPVIQHFFSCDDQMALDFIEACFQVWGNCGRQRGVETINGIFQDAAIGFELTPFVEIDTGKPGMLFGAELGTVIEYRYPQFIKKDSEYLHADAVQPALVVLSDARYQGANEEFLRAHEHFRHARYQECLNECLKSFESTMKIICHNKGWAYNQNDTASILIQKCLNSALVPTFSQQQLTSLRTLLESGVPTVRNKLGGHGQGVQQNTVPMHLAQYALHLTAATVLLLVRCAEP